jgi:hypothetical protein
MFQSGPASAPAAKRYVIPEERKKRRMGMKIACLIAFMLLVSPSLGHSNGKMLIASPTEQGLRDFISELAGPSHVETIELSNHGRAVQLFQFDKTLNNLCLGYFNDRSGWHLFLHDNFQPGSLAIHVQSTNIISYNNDKGSSVEVNLETIKALK